MRISKPAIRLPSGKNVSPIWKMPRYSLMSYFTVGEIINTKHCVIREIKPSDYGYNSVLDRSFTVAL